MSAKVAPAPPAVKRKRKEPAMSDAEPIRLTVSEGVAPVCLDRPATDTPPIAPTINRSLPI